VSKHFLDSNVIIYAFSSGPKQDRALALLSDGGTVAVQTLNEIANVARRKLRMSWDDVRSARAQIIELCSVWEGLTAQTQLDGLGIAERYQLSTYDSMLIIAALESGCDTFVSEDLHRGLRIEGRLIVTNPFRDSA